MPLSRVGYWVTCLGLAACSRSAPEATPHTELAAEPPPASSAVTAPSLPLAAPKPGARVGEAAPDFELPDLDGTLVRLSSLRGKTVVLEWFNPGCPFVKASHTKGSLSGSAARHQKSGVVWLAINSGAPGKQGHGVEANRVARQTFGLSHPILLDESGAVGKAYGAAHTPHLFVIDAQGTLVYRGAIDNSPDGEGDSPTGGKLVNYVDGALSDLSAGRPVRTAETDAYGCSVKYAN